MTATDSLTDCLLSIARAAADRDLDREMSSFEGGRKMKKPRLDDYRHHNHRSMIEDYLDAYFPDTESTHYSCVLSRIDNNVPPYKVHLHEYASEQERDDDPAHEFGRYLGAIHFFADGTSAYSVWERGSGYSHTESLDPWHPAPLKVGYYGGESRTNPGQAADYMHVAFDCGKELYAEMSTDADDENANYAALKAEIILQAAALKIPADHLKFWFDEK